eukprot:TRINITY_DN6236_c0_g1_i1.p1 TRINITY_DN6236_c0_g1~~TRINITY_DN6236_c0_g1_i1.p1  ORF type:complete len:109 (-),score=27.67 TRINITY_DN6236_c0_g1_i1:65-391(-)
MRPLTLLIQRSFSTRVHQPRIKFPNRHGANTHEHDHTQAHDGHTLSTEASKPRASSPPPVSNFSNSKISQPLPYTSLSEQECLLIELGGAFDRPKPKLSKASVNNKKK